ncbi:helix-turn-helix domain-containing protein [Marinovum sp.]|uniref:helix-turn-helix domain-containing protein n=1 Tax=Marinovum sp. TaxID=2024839 RepID=UPI003A8CCA4A
MTSLRNNSMDRGITVLEVLAAGGGMSLAQLHKETGIPKTPLRRLLNTMVDRRFVRRSVADGRYRANILIPRWHNPDFLPHLSDLSDLIMPSALALTEKIEWPTDIHMMGYGCMTMVDSTRKLSPFQLYVGNINIPINIFGSASGIACLSQLSREAVEDVMDLRANDALYGLGRFGLSRTEYFAILDRAREAGYGSRLPNYIGEAGSDDGLAGMAVPFRKQNRVIGAAVVMYLKKHKKPEDFARDNLQALSETAQRITEALDRA